MVSSVNAAETTTTTIPRRDTALSLIVRTGSLPYQLWYHYTTYHEDTHTIRTASQRSPRRGKVVLARFGHNSDHARERTAFIPSHKNVVKGIVEVRPMKAVAKDPFSLSRVCIKKMPKKHQDQSRTKSYDEPWGTTPISASAMIMLHCTMALIIKK